MAGIGLPMTSSDSVFEVIELIRSREFVKHLMTFEDVLPALMAPGTYDPGSQKLSFDLDIYDSSNKEWVREIEGSLSVIPSYLETHRVYLNAMNIVKDKSTGFIAISFEHISPVFAKDFLTLIIEEANTIMREKDIKTSTQALSYLKNEFATTSLREIKESINQLIENQLETQMMANINEEYSLVILDPPFIPDKKSRPSRSIIVILSTMLGGFLGLMYVVIRHFFYTKTE